MSILKSDIDHPNPAIATLSRIPSRRREPPVTSTLIWVTAVRFRAMKASLRLWKSAGSIDEFTDTVWGALNEDNKVSLFVRYIDIETGVYETRIVNKNI